MTEQHPITPPPELVEQWMHEASGQPPGPDARVIATQAARWGADQELEACCEWLEDFNCSKRFTAELCAARRPKPRSLKEQALVVLDDLRSIDATHYNILRNALEQLND